jgi:ubiquinone/menaquinone biosynthesis C-methylase UbiE
VTDRVVDGEYLRRVQYATEANLAARQAIYKYRQPPARSAPWALDLVALRGEERVLDLGCGNGLYLAELERRAHDGRIVGIDLSVGMLDAARSRSTAALSVGDAQALPFARDSFDCLLAMHMLYHVPDRDLALTEMARVVHPGGTVLLMTNSTHHLEELNSLLVDAGQRGFERAYLRFSAESGATELRAHFSSVERHVARAELVVTDAQAVVDYAASGWAAVAPDAARTEMLREVERRTLEHIESDGAFRIRIEVACFVCRTPRRTGVGAAP